jgi:hypothetical protein
MNQIDHTSACELARTNPSSRVPVERVLTAWTHGSDLSMEESRHMQVTGSALCGSDQRCLLVSGRDYTIAFYVFAHEIGAPQVISH